MLSIEKLSPIQVYSHKELTKMLHRMQPNVYKDDNHKPEMMLAVTNFQALCVFTHPAGNIFYNGAVFIK